MTTNPLSFVSILKALGIYEWAGSDADVFDAGLAIEQAFEQAATFMIVGDLALGIDEVLREAHRGFGIALKRTYSRQDAINSFEEVLKQSGDSAMLVKEVFRQACAGKAYVTPQLIQEALKKTSVEQKAIGAPPREHHGAAPASIPTKGTVSSKPSVAEERHLDDIDKILAGKVPPAPSKSPVTSVPSPPTTPAKDDLEAYLASLENKQADPDKAPRTLSSAAEASPDVLDEILKGLDSSQVPPADKSKSKKGPEPDEIDKLLGLI